MKRSWWIVLLLVVALTAAACGSDRDDDPQGGGTTDTTEASGGDQGDDEGEVTFGDLPSPCGQGDGGGATDQGVTADSIKIGYGDDAGFANSPGLNHQMSDAVKAMIKWCNDQGGINGREIEGTYYDAKITEVNNVWLEACPKEFFMVGQGFSLDAAQETTRRGCGLPSVPGYAVSPQFANAPLKVEAIPVPADYTVISHAARLAELYPEKVKKASVVFANYSATIDSKDKVSSVLPQFGYSLSCEQQYNIQGESDWKPFAQKLKDCGIEVVYFVGSPFPNFQNLLTAADQLDFKPIWFTDPNFYDDNFRKWNSSGLADNVHIRVAFIPFEEADENKATQDFLDAVEETGGDANLLGAQSASAFLLWATAANECGAELTRDCVMTELKSIKKWTGGGLHAEANPGDNLPPQCSLMIKLDGTSFVRVSPEESGEYDCDPKYAAKVSGPALQRAKLDANRISQL